MAHSLRFVPALIALLAAALIGGCAETDAPQNPSERFHSGETTRVGEKIDFEQTQPDVTGDVPIRQLLDLSDPSGDPAPVWFGFAPGDAYPQGEKRKFGEACDANFGNKTYKLEKLPAVIEGVVTLAPRHYEKVGTCGEDHRYYGSYFLQDETGAILVLKNSRISDFTYGDRVRLRVRGVTKQFGTLAVLAADETKIDREPTTVPYEKLETSYRERFELTGQGWERGTNCWNIADGFAVPPGFGSNFRIRGRVCQEPNNRNFNEMLVQPNTKKCVDDPDFSWTVSLGLELGRRGLDIDRGEVVTVTGPVSGQLVGLTSCEWSLRMVATTMGQIGQFTK